MKKSKVLKIGSYLLIPVLVAIMSLSLLANYFANEEIYENENEYFLTDTFVSSYMGLLADYARELIYNNEQFLTCYDGETQICYIDDYQNAEIKDCYVLVRYQNKALTNVELTAQTNTIEKIMNYISQNEGSKKVNIFAGNIVSDSNIIANKGLKYFNYFEHRYYRLNEALEDTENFQGEVDVVEVPMRTYVDVGIQDFNIYSSYKEEFVRDSAKVIAKDFFSNFNALGDNIHFVVPACLVGLVIIAIYLIVAIGHTKENDEIDLNDIDKIPYEILWFVALAIFGICILIVEWCASLFDNLDLCVSMITGAYIMIYSVCAVLFDTTVKRIKAKTILKNTLFYKCISWIWRIGKKVKNKLSNVWDKSSQNMNLVKKIVALIFVYIVIAIGFLILFQGFGFIIDIALGIFLFYKIIVERINCFTQIESHLKSMYEGKNKEMLQPVEFTSEFQNTVKYINDISNGFENAIQERIKSERLKTELITNVSHDIKTPLTSIINYVDLVKKEEIENEKVKEYIEVLDNKSQRLKKLTEDLIEASKASSGNVKLNLEKINVPELIKQTTGEFEDKFKAKKLKIITNIPENEVYIQADNRYMYRIIENIFSNVAKYSMENSRVYIDVVKKGEKVYIDVKNISKEILNISEEELMQRFVRGDKSRTLEGSGLGLSISQSLTELQNGKLTIKVDGDLFKTELEFNII